MKWKELFILILIVFSLSHESKSNGLVDDLMSKDTKRALAQVNVILSHPTEYPVNIVQLAIGLSGEVGDERVIEHLNRILNDKFPKKEIYKSLGIEDTTENNYKIWADSVENLLCNYPEDVLEELSEEYQKNLEMVCKNGFRVSDIGEKEAMYDNTTRALCTKALSELYPRINAEGIKGRIIDALVKALERKENDEVVRASAAEMLGNTFSAKAYEPLKEIVENESENPLVRLSASRSLTQITEMHPELTGGHSNYVSEPIIQNAVNHLLGEIFGIK